MSKRVSSSFKFQAGFTLIELLIVVVIIVILVAIGAASYSTVARSSRDSQRQSDLAKISQALEEYYADHNFYPTTNINGHSPAQFETAGQYVSLDKIGCLLGGLVATSMAPQANQWTCTQDRNGNLIPPPYNTYLANGRSENVPKDPLSGYYAYSSDGQSYVLLSQCYEGRPSVKNLFTSTHRYYSEAVDWSHGPNTVSCGTPWEGQYYLSSPRG